ncbi:type IV pilus biogenesis protein PilM [Dyella ginsengisoli]|uniref:type IV pilus biogenesis protein PilM n=1 Tax=Dyella ginsengisoli TaxID=363848 RepID=UPI000A00CE9D|nr:type IV pilus biogenesis protein PilM [Dyella ginsengisoli]
MITRLVIVALLFLAMLGAYELHTHERSTAIQTQSQSELQNLAVYSRAVAYYASTHSSATGPVADSGLSTLPNGYLKSHPWAGYMQNGNAWVYLAPGGTYAPQTLMREAGSPGRSLGVKAGTVAKDATGTVVVGDTVAIPNAIPDGSAVYLSQIFGTPPAAPPPMVIQSQPPPNPPLAASVPPITLVAGGAVTSSPTGWSCCSTPGAPLPPPPPAPPPPPPPASNPLTDPTICASNGGMPYTATPVSIYAGVGGTMFGGGAVSSFRSTTTSRGTATGSYAVKIDFDSTSSTVTLNCTRTNTSFPTAGDACTYSQVFSVGRGTFNVSINTSSPLAADWIRGSQAPVGASAQVGQLNCN